MEMTPARAQFAFEEEWVPLRSPKTQPATNTHMPLNTAVNTNVSTQKLSPYAKEFVPRGLGATSNDNNGIIYSQQTPAPSQQQQPNYEQYQQPQHLTNGYHQQQQQQQQLHHHQQQQQQQHSQHFKQQQQQRIQQQQQMQQQFNHQQSQQPQQQQQHQLIQMTGSVQDRLNPTYFQQPKQYQQLQQHQQQHAQHQQQRYIRCRYNNKNNNQQQQPTQNQHHHLQQQQHQQHHHQQQLTSTSSSSSSSTTHSNNAQGQQNQQSNANSSNSVETIALDYLKTVMSCLDGNPGQFDIVAPRFVNIYDGMENNEFVLMHAMEDIFEESIKNSNFRYMGAKLYNLLHMLNPKSESLFHHLLKLKLDYHQNLVSQYIQEKQFQKVRETALFLAELYMQLRWDADETQRIYLLAENIIYSLKNLLVCTLDILENDPTNKDGADNVRCICLTLKLAGYDLTKDCVADMTYIIEQLELIIAQFPGRYALAENVINLQKNNWGRKTSLTSSSDNDHLSSDTARQPEVLRESDEPIFYGPDGRELTAEESDFLSKGMAAFGVTEDDEPSTPDPDIDFDHEMEEEHELAYLEFCKENANKK